MNCQFFDKNKCHIIIGVNFLTSHKYIYGQSPHRKDILVIKTDPEGNTLE